MPRDRNRRIVLASGVGATQRVAQLLTALITLPLAIHVLGVSGFGVWGAATSLAWLAGMLDLGLGSALVNLLPKVLADGRSDSARDYVSASLIGSCVLGLGVLGVGIGLVAAFARPTDLGPLLIAVIGLALNVPLSVAGNAWFGLQRGYVAGLWELFQTLLTLVLIVLAATFHGGVISMVAAVYGALILSNCGSLLHLMVRHPEIRPIQVRTTIHSMYIVLSQGGLLFGITFATSVAYLLDNFLTLQWLGSAASAQITVGLRLCTTAAGLLGVLTQPLWPALVDAFSVGDHGWALRTLSYGTLALAAATAAGAALIVRFGGQLIPWWLQADMTMPPVLLWAIGGWIIALCVPRVATLWLTARSALRFQLMVTAAAALSALALKYALSRRFGAAGILGSTSISWFLIAWPAYIWKISRIGASPAAARIARC
jgi:O-antigen/teichoic acid export membrane protein